MPIHESGCLYGSNKNIAVETTGEQLSRIARYWSGNVAAESSDSDNEGSIQYEGKPTSELIHLSLREETPDSTVEALSKASSLSSSSLDSSKVEVMMNVPGVSIPDDVPRNLRSQLNAWYQKNRQRTAPCLTHTSLLDPSRSEQGSQAYWQNAAGMKLMAKFYTISDGIVTNSKKHSRILVVEGEGGSQIPTIVKWVNGGGGRINYKAWIWPQGDKDGFEYEASVLKIMKPSSKNANDTNGVAQRTTIEKRTPTARAPEAQIVSTFTTVNRRISMDEKTASQQLLEASNHDSKVAEQDQAELKGLRPRVSILPPNKFAPSAVSEYVTEDFAKHSRKRKHEEVEDDVGGETLVNSFRKASPSRTPDQIGKGVKKEPSASKDYEHMYTNVVLLFHAVQIGEPRIRRLRQCDSVQKLFAQAITGIVFSADATMGSRVLNLSFGANVDRRERRMMEGDEQDYEAFLEDLAGSGYWEEINNVTRGCLAVEVRAV